MTQMADLYGGSLLEQFFLSDSSTFEEWATLQREWLNREVMEALDHLTNYHERRGDYAQARVYAQRQVQLEPWREEAHRQLMRLLALDGQRSAALAQYQTCRRTLAQELNVEPTAETRLLAEQIRAEEELRAKPPAHHLPTSPTPFVGRKEELADLADLLADPDCRLVSLIGPGGIGKTRLALQTATDHIGVFDHGVHYIPLASITSSNLLASTMVSALGIPPYSTQSPQDLLQSYLHNKEMLLVLDNMEHLLDASLLLNELLQRAPGLMILVTSRERLNLQEEQVYEVGGLRYPEGETPEVESHSAVDLFEQCARRADRHFSIGKAEMAHTVRICQMVEGMPLGVELAAAWVRARSCEEIAREVEHNLDILTTRLRDVPKRHRSVRATFEYSWQLLAGAERNLLARLSVFQGGFHPQAAARVAGASPTTLSNLLDKSLIRRISSERYDMHNLLRQFAVDKLKTTPQELARTQREYVRHFSSFLEQQAEHLRGQGQKQALLRIGLEIENARQMWKTAIAQGSADLIERSIDSLYYFYLVQCRYQEGIDLFDQAIKRWGEGSERESVFGKAQSRQGALRRRWGHYTQARTGLEKSLRVFERLESRTEQIFCLINLADVNRGQGRSEEAEQLAQRSLALSRQAGDNWGITRSLTLLGLVRYRAGNIDQAETLLEESLTLARASGNQRLIMLPLNALGDVACHRGNYARAQIVFEECLALSRELGDLFNVAIHLNNLGTVLHACEAYEEARGTYQESLEICQEIGDQRGQAIALSNLGEVAFALGAHREALAYYQRALSMGREVDDHWTILACLNNLGETACALEDYEEAKACFTEALRIASETQTLVILLKTIVNLAVLYAQRGQTDRAATLLALARRHPACEQSDHDKAKRLLEEMGLTQPHSPLQSLDDVIAEILEEITDDVFDAGT
jgi:predicted ATPase/Tfp pilus assembly protein PilF